MNPALSCPSLAQGEQPEPADRSGGVQLQCVLDAMPSGVVVIDGAGRVEVCNAAACEFFGEPLRGARWRDVVARALPEGVPAATADGLTLPGGRQVSVATAPLGDGPGQLVLIQDITASLVAADAPPPDISLSDPEADDDMLSVDPRSRHLAALARRVAGTDATVMLTGESGVGKEVLARYIHRHSPRVQGPFVAINCAAIPDNMLEATLFGHEKGAFTGAYASAPGKFEQAQDGTLLLDEITEMDLGLQAKLLRVLQEREVERLGARRPIRLNVRVLATSNRALREEVAAGRFREDLFYRLNVFPLHLPALRERAADILPLARRLLARGAHAQGRATPCFAPDAEARLLDHAWPGNVRELDNVLQRALILQPGAVIAAADLQFETCGAPASAPAVAQAPAAVMPAGLDMELRGREREVLVEALRSVRGSRKAAAELLGISERTLRYKLAKIRKAGLEVPV